MKTKVLCWMIVLLSVGFGASAQLHLGSKMEVYTYPNQWVPDVLVHGEGKSITFKLANFSASSIVRACKLYIVDPNNIPGANVVWEDVVSIGAWDFVDIRIAGCDQAVTTAAGNYKLLLVADNTNNLDAITILSPIVPAVDGGSGASNPHDIEIEEEGSFLAGCANYYWEIDAPTTESIWTPGETYSINWSSNFDHLMTKVSINLYNAGSIVALIADGVNNTGNFSYIVPSNLPKKSGYYFKFFPMDGPYVVGQSETFTIGPQASVPATPNNLQVEEISDTQLKISWDDVDNESCYILSYCNGEVVEVIPKDTTSYLVGGLNPSSLYSFKVLGFNKYGTGEFSACVSARTLDPPAPDMIVHSYTIPSSMQKGEPVSMQAIYYNQGTANYEDDLYISLHDGTGEFITDLVHYRGTIMPQDSVVLSFSSQAVQSDVGSYKILIKQGSAAQDSFFTDRNTATSIVGMEVMYANEIATIQYINEPVEVTLEVSPSSSGTANLRSFLILRDVGLQESYIYEMTPSTLKTTMHQFRMEIILSELGQYEAQTATFFDWNNDEVRDENDMPWFCFWSDTIDFSVEEKTFGIADVTIDDENIIAQYSTVHFSAKAMSYDNQESMSIRIYSRNSGETQVLDMQKGENQYWSLHHMFEDVSWYDYRLIMVENTDTVYYPTLDMKPLSLQVYPFVSTIGSEINNDDTNISVGQTPVLLKGKVYAQGIQNLEVVCNIISPSGVSSSLFASEAYLGVYTVETVPENIGSYAYYFSAYDDLGNEHTSSKKYFVSGFRSDCQEIVSPPLITREQWCSGCENTNFDNGFPTHIIVHHTATTNGSDGESVVKAIYNDHINRGFPDIGYHYLIASNGQIYEGLEGGPLFKGSHFSCMNGRTIGIAMLGNFMQEGPSDEALEALDVLLEYLCAEYNIDPVGVSDHRFYYAAKDTFLVNADMPKISPHHIANDYQYHACSSTSCPGDDFPNIADEIAPNVYYCSTSGQHLALELASNIVVITGASSTKSSGQTLETALDVVALTDGVMTKFRTLVHNMQDTILLAETEDMWLDALDTLHLNMSGQVNELDTNYYVLVQYLSQASSTWISLNSEQFANNQPINQEMTTDVIQINKPALAIYPNPTSGQLYVQMPQEKKYWVSIHNSIGQRVFAKTMYGQQLQLNLHLDPGIYVLRILDNDALFVQKFVMKDGKKAGHCRLFS